MKKILSLLAATVTVFSCNDSENSFTLNGTIDPSYNGSEVYLAYSAEKIDTTIVENGKFTFKGEVEFPEFAVVTAQKAQDYAQGRVIIEKGNININLKGGREYEASGSTLNTVYNDVTAKMEQISKEFGDEYKKLSETKDIAVEVINAKVDSLYTIFMSKKNEYLSKVFTDNKDNLIGAEAMTSLYSDKATFDSLYNVAGEAVKRDTRIVAEKTRMENIEKTSAGKMFTDFTIENGNADSSSVKFSDYVGKGKYVLVDFWASWCGPCKAEMPNLANIYKKYKGNKFEILGVAVWDKRENTIKALESLPITWPIIFDAQKIPTDIYGINGIPQIILFAPDGTIVARDLRGDAIGEKLAEIFAKK